MAAPTSPPLPAIADPEEAALTGLDARFWQRLNWLRGFLSLYVLVHHAVQLCWPAAAEVAEARPALGALARAGSATFHFGLHAVMVFFVVSGASIHARMAQLGPAAAFDAADFARRRARRIYPALLVSLALSAALGALIAAPELTWANLLGTALFQQGLLCEMFAGNVPYWSLAFEGYYYAAYPLLLRLLQRSGAKAYVTLLALALVAAALGGKLPTVLALYPVWLAGALLVDLRAAREPAPTWLVAALLLLFGGALPYYLLVGLTAQDSVLPWLVFGLGAFGLVEAWLRSELLGAAQGRLRAALDASGDLSYSLYLNHYLVFAALGHFFPPDPERLGRSLALTAAGTALALALSAASYHLVEKRFLRAR